MKLRWMVALLAACSVGSALAQDVSSPKGKLSYSVGYQIGKDFTDCKMDIDINTVIKAIQDGHAQRQTRRRA